MLKVLIALLVGTFIFTTSSVHAGSTQQPSRQDDYRKIAYCIEAGRDNGDTDEEITERCIPSGDALEDYE